MIITDHHVHTEFSGDSKTPMEEVVHKAISLGMKEVMFTDHLDLNYPSSEICFEIDFEKYLKKLQVIRDKYKEVSILMGIEIGYRPELNSRLNEILDEYDFDFVICSVHSWDNLELDKGHMFIGKSQQEGYKDYFKKLKYTVDNFQNCDVYGHLDLILRYGKFENRKLDLEVHKEIIDEILKTIIKNGKGIELNTSGLRYGLDEMHPSSYILKRYLDLGGKIITLGSDAHISKHLCADFNKAIALLKEVGFKQITTFKGRKPNFINI